jgi:hypothetical protein
VQAFRLGTIRPGMLQQVQAGRQPGACPEVSSGGEAAVQVGRHPHEVTSRKKLTSAGKQAEACHGAIIREAMQQRQSRAHLGGM